jgi:hypothetical protein
MNLGWHWHGGFATKVKGSKSVIFVYRKVEAISPSTLIEEIDDEEEFFESDSKKSKMK